jgi:hypothetical protein
MFLPLVFLFNLTFLSQEYFLPIQTRLHTPMVSGTHFSRMAAKSKVSINLYYHQTGLYTLVALETHLSGAVVWDQCFTLQGSFQCPLLFFCLAFLVGSNSTGATLSSPSCLSKWATYPCVWNPCVWNPYVWSRTHIFPGQYSTSLYGI